MSEYLIIVALVAIAAIGVVTVFNSLPSLAALKAKEFHDELVRYLSTDPEQVADVLLWWTEHKATYPCLPQMALDHLSIPGMYFAILHYSIQIKYKFTATSTDVGCIFS